MARIIDAFTQYCDGAGNPLARGKLYFYGIGALSTTAKDTFSVTDETPGTENANPLLLDGEGRVPPCFGTGSYTIKLTDKNDTKIDTFTPVGGTDSLDPFADWSTLINYQIASQPVKGSNSFYYKSRTDNNLGNDPVSDGGVNWVRIRFLGDYNSLTSYVIGDVVIDSSANLWASQTDPNLNNTPSSDSGTNWLPAVNGAKIPQVIQLQADVTALDTWINKAADFTIVAGESYQIDASGGSVNAAMPATLGEGDFIIVHNESISTSTVLLTNPNFTIKGPAGTIAAGTDLALTAGATAHLVAKSTTILEAV